MFFSKKRQKLLKNGCIKPQKPHSLLYGRDILFNEIFTLRGQDRITRIIGKEVSNSSFIEDDSVRGKLLVGAHHGVGIDAYIGPVFSHGRNPVPSLEFSSQDAVADNVRNLEVYWFFRIEVHKL